MARVGNLEDSWDVNHSGVQVGMLWASQRGVIEVGHQALACSLRGIHLVSANRGGFDSLP